MTYQPVARDTIAVLLAALILIPTGGLQAGGMADKDLKNAAKFEKAAEFLKSAEAYARVLRLEPGNKQAKSGLQRVAGSAIAEKLTLARDFEASLRYSDAQAELSAALALQDRIRAAGITLDAELDAKTAQEGLVDRWVAILYDEGINAQNDELWSAAVAHFRMIESLRPATRDVRARLTEVWTSWGNQELDLQMFRSAAGRFIEASRIPGHGGASAAEKAAEILTQLGVHALDRGACRSAVRDLRAATEAAPGVVSPDTLASAERCALTCLSLAVSPQPDLEMERSRLERIGSEVRNMVVNQGSSFLMVSAGGSVRGGPCDSRPATSALEATTTGTSRRIRATVEITSQALFRSPATSRNSEFRSQQTIGGQIVGESVTVIRVYDEVFSGSMTGTITFADQTTGRTSPAIPVRVQGEAAAQWVKNPATVVATGTAVRSIGVAGGPRLDRLSNIDDQRLEARSRLKNSLAEDFVIETARIILETIDAEPGVSDPVSLDLSFRHAPRE